MIIQTPYSDIIHCLPNNAQCKLTGMSPEKMYKCPICNFDNYGDVCIPEICSEYTEINKKRRLLEKD